MPRISYETNGFPAGTITDGTAELSVTWDDILWAAMTVGRPNRHYVFRHGTASLYEALFRCSLVRMALEQSSPSGYRLRRTNAAKTLDPTEKGAVNYFLGMTFCKLFAEKLLNTPWLLHLDVFRPRLNPMLTGRSRPDLVGKEHRTSRWHAFECKGRLSPPDSPTKAKAKAQANRLVSVNGTRCGLHIGAITYFRRDALQFYWHDPLPKDGNHVDVPYHPDAWRHYYLPVVQIVIAANHQDAMQTSENIFAPVEGLDLKVGIHPAVAKYLFMEKWDEAQHIAELAASEIAQAGYQPDGLLVKSGPSWHEPFRE